MFAIVCTWYEFRTESSTGSEIRRSHKRVLPHTLHVRFLWLEQIGSYQMEQSTAVGYKIL